MEGQLGLSESSVISWVSAVEGCPLSEVILYTVLAYTSSHLSIGKKSVHSLQEAALQHIGLVHDEHNLLISAPSATQYLPQVIIKVRSQILAVDLGVKGQI